jgi:hypothetical protein
MFNQNGSEIVTRFLQLNIIFDIDFGFASCPTSLLLSYSLNPLINIVIELNDIFALYSKDNSK